MKWAQKYKNSTRGFTIVELLVVVIVIAVLASVTVVGYMTIQANARDSVRVTHLNDISKALTIYGMKKGGLIGQGSGCGYNGRGSGWFNAGVDDQTADDPGVSPYQKSILDCLIEAGYLSERVIDPTGITGFGAASAGLRGRNTYMKYNCSQVSDPEPQIAYVFARLESSTHKPMASEDICPEWPHVADAYNRYAMNYYVRVTLE